MGLDSFIKAKKYIGNWDHSSQKEKTIYSGISKLLGFNGEPLCQYSPGMTIAINVCYWRKANEIHNWFVQNIQNGEDDCNSYFIPREKLKELVNLCKTVKQTKNTDLLPTQSGFFFGSTEHDEYYYENLDYTIKQLEGVIDCPELEGFDFYYQASW